MWEQRNFFIIHFSLQESQDTAKWVTFHLHIQDISCLCCNAAQMHNNCLDIYQPINRRILRVPGPRSLICLPSKGEGNHWNLWGIWEENTMDFCLTLLMKVKCLLRTIIKLRRQQNVCVSCLTGSEVKRNPVVKTWAVCGFRSDKYLVLEKRKEGLGITECFKKLTLSISGAL